MYLTHLYAGARVLSAEAAGQSPAAGGDVGHLGDGLHLLRTADAHLTGRNGLHDTRAWQHMHVSVREADR